MNRKRQDTIFWLGISTALVGISVLTTVASYLVIAYGYPLPIYRMFPFIAGVALVAVVVWRRTRRWYM